MQTATFDTRAPARALKEAGFEETQATAIVDALRQAMTEGVATKADIATLRTELTANLSELKADSVAGRDDLDRALWISAAGIIGLTVALLKIL